MKPYDPKLTPYLRWLLYGKPGSTKTRTAYTAALDDRTYPCLALNVSGNPLSARTYARQPDILEMDNLEDFNVVYNWIANGQRSDSPFVKEYNLHPPYKCLIVDGVTETQRISFRQATGNTTTGPGSFGPAAQRQHFGQVLAQMVTFSKLFYSLPLHVIITSLEKEEKDEATGAITMAPLLWGQSDVEVGGYAYLVSRMVHREIVNNTVLKILETTTPDVVSVALFKPSGKYDAKDQYHMVEGGKPIDIMANPTVTRILDAIWGPETKQLALPGMK